MQSISVIGRILGIDMLEWAPPGCWALRLFYRHVREECFLIHFVGSLDNSIIPEGPFGSGMRQSSHDPHIPTTRTPLGYPCEWIGHCYERQ